MENRRFGRKKSDFMLERNGLLINMNKLLKRKSTSKPSKFYLAERLDLLNIFIKEIRADQEKCPIKTIKKKL